MQKNFSKTLEHAVEALLSIAFLPRRQSERCKFAFMTKTNYEFNTFRKSMEIKLKLINNSAGSV